ncbi:hypothetical protein ACOZ38_17200 [Sphaerisporangium viridialbum]|uniref:hypothetical protein n=1 Tax=Sphaerisporangium viridialbum TaxID=46189 RepID=UPI003C75CF6D
MRLLVLGPLDIAIDGRAVPLRSAKQRVPPAVPISRLGATELRARADHALGPQVVQPPDLR